MDNRFWFMFHPGESLINIKSSLENGMTLFEPAVGWFYLLWFFYVVEYIDRHIFTNSIYKSRVWFCYKWSRPVLTYLCSYPIVNQHIIWFYCVSMLLVFIDVKNSYHLSANNTYNYRRTVLPDWHRQKISGFIMFFVDKLAVLV